MLQIPGIYTRVVDKRHFTSRKKSIMALMEKVHRSFWKMTWNIANSIYQFFQAWSESGGYTTHTTMDSRKKCKLLSRVWGLDRKTIYRYSKNDLTIKNSNHWNGSHFLEKVVIFEKMKIVERFEFFSHFYKNLEKILVESFLQKKKICSENRKILKFIE